MMQRTQKDDESSRKLKGSSRQEDESSRQEDEQNFSKEQLISFIFKAVNKGGMVLKDADTTLQCLQELMHDRDAATTHEKGIFHVVDVDNELINVEGGKAESKKGNGSSVERDDMHGPLDNNPSVINQVVVSKEATVPRQGEVCPSSGSPCLWPSLHVMNHRVGPNPDTQRPFEEHVPLEGTQHSFSGMIKHGSADVSKEACSLPKVNLCCPPHVIKRPCSCSFLKNQNGNTSSLLVNESFQEGKNTQQETTKSLLSDLLTKEADLCGNHVASSPKPLNFLEAAKQALKNSSKLDVGVEGKNASYPFVASNNSPIFKVDNEVFHKRMKLCKFSVVGKVTMVKGDDPWTWSKLKQKLDSLWGFNSGWRLVSLGKGFFHIILTSQEELNSVWSKGVLHLKPGVLRVQRWTFGFDPSKEKTTCAQVWIRIHHLPWCLWDPSIINSIACKVGVPLRIDNMTLDGNYGHFARVLVEVDVSKPIMSSVLLECDHSLMEIKIVPENLPSFCKGCLTIGHSAMDCKILNKWNNGPNSTKQATEESLPIDREDNSNSLKRNSQLPVWRKKKIHVTENNAKERESGPGSLRTTSNVNSKEKFSQQTSKANLISESVTDFGAQDRPQISKNSCSSDLPVFNPFSVLQADEDVEEVMTSNPRIQDRPQLSSGSKRDHRDIGMDEKIGASSSKRNEQHTEWGRKRVQVETEAIDEEMVVSPSPLVQESEKKDGVGDGNYDQNTEFDIDIPRVPSRWSDLIDEEDIAENPYPPQEVHPTNMETSPIFERTYGNISGFRAKLHEDCIWLNPDAPNYDRDMCVEIERFKNSAKATRNFIANLPKKDKKVKIAFRHPQGKAYSPKE